MNNLVPYSFELPVSSDGPPRLPQPNERMSLRYIVGVILSRAWRAIAVAAALFILVVGIAFQIPKTYFAEGAVLIQPSRTNLAHVDQLEQAGPPPDTSAIDTEVEVLRSRALAEEVTNKLRLYDDPEFNSALTTSEPVRLSWRWPVRVQIELPFNWQSVPKLSWITSLFTSSDKEDPDVDLTRTDNSRWLSRTTNVVMRRTYVRRVGLTYVVHVGFPRTIR